MATITGTNANDTLAGTAGNDTINSGNGDDVVTIGATASGEPGPVSGSRSGPLSPPAGAHHRER